MKKMCELLDIDKIELSQNEKMRLLIGDMELSFSELNACVNYHTRSDSTYHKYIGEVRAYLNCLIVLEVIEEQQRETMYAILDEMEKTREYNKGVLGCMFPKEKNQS